MINPDYIRTMAEYNAEMNRRLYGAAVWLSDPEQRLPRGAIWGSIHGTLTHILWATSSGCRGSMPGRSQVLRSSKVPA